MARHNGQRLHELPSQTFTVDGRDVALKQDLTVIRHNKLVLSLACGMAGYRHGYPVGIEAPRTPKALAELRTLA